MSDYKVSKSLILVPFLDMYGDTWPYHIKKGDLRFFINLTTLCIPNIKITHPFLLHILPIIWLFTLGHNFSTRILEILLNRSCPLSVQLFLSKPNYTISNLYHNFWYKKKVVSIVCFLIWVSTSQISKWSIYSLKKSQS